VPVVAQPVMVSAEAIATAVYVWVFFMGGWFQLSRSKS